MITEYRFDKLNVGGSIECLLHSFIKQFSRNKAYYKSSNIEGP